MPVCKCSICNKKGFHGYKAFVIDGVIKEYCPEHVSQAPIRKEMHITDATGKVRDRVWLNNKLEITRTEKSWKKDIQSRRVAPDGTVYRKDKS